jgi:hypothetical protein
MCNLARDSPRETKEATGIPLISLELFASNCNRVYKNPIRGSRILRAFSELSNYIGGVIYRDCLYVYCKKNEREDYEGLYDIDDSYIEGENHVYSISIEDDRDLNLVRNVVKMSLETYLWSKRDDDILIPPEIAHRLNIGYTEACSTVGTILEESKNFDSRRKKVPIREEDVSSVLKNISLRPGSQGVGRSSVRYYISSNNIPGLLTDVKTLSKDLDDRSFLQLQGIALELGLEIEIDGRLISKGALCERIGKEISRRQEQ